MVDISSSSSARYKKKRGTVRKNWNPFLEAAKMGVFQKKIYLPSWKSEKLVKPAPHSLRRRLLLLPHSPQPARIRFQQVNWMFPARMAILKSSKWTGGGKRLPNIWSGRSKL